MLKKILLLVLMLLTANVCWAADLNAPAQKQITVGSEISRGHAEMFSALLDAGANFSKAGQATFNVLNRNKSNNTDTDAFYLGAYFEAWNKYAILLSDESDKSYYGQDTWSQGEASCRLWFKEFRKMEDKLNIDDKTLCEVVHMKYEVIKPMIDKWESK